ncbi:hypothetical protein FLONG3_3009 [Fusarium longipes]|uniref:CBM-cenC domain-containing protein n=1 Tax=Fusarium longipes TaxID=694270 RepID=A0A395T2B2_9HYPO|nr:hypothetical protein FLONG3_3009 [Fusarium longipes]
MRVTLQLLALCCSALASPCKPSASSATSDLTTSTELASLSTTQLPIVSESAAATDMTTEPSVSTTSTELSTTTSDLPQQPTNFLRNGDFEDNTIAPWILAASFGDPTISTAEAYEGNQSGFISAAPGGPAHIGFRQFLDASSIEPDKPYLFTVRVKTTVISSCFSRFLSCDVGTGSFNTANIQGPLNEWVSATLTCSWSQAQLGQGISVTVRGICERLSFYIDDASIVAVE